MQRTPFYFQRETAIEGRAFPAGSEAFVIESPDGVPVDRLLNAAARNIARPDKPAVEPASPAATGAAAEEAPPAQA